MRLVSCFLAAAFLAASFIIPPVSYAEDTPGPSGNSNVEERLVNTGYALGLSAARGWSFNGGTRKLEFVEVMPNAAFPLSGVIGRSFYRGVLEYKAEAVLGIATNKDGRGIAGLSPLGLRYDFTPLGGRLTPYLECMVGAVYLNVPRDIQGTRFNFISGAGAGARYFVSDRLAVDLGFRYRHLSNAGIRLPNKGVNTGFVVVGLSYY